MIACVQIPGMQEYRHRRQALCMMIVDAGECEIAMKIGSLIVCVRIPGIQKYCHHRRALYMMNVR